MEGIPGLKFRISRLMNGLAFWAFAGWSLVLPFAQIQQTRFTSMCLFIILGAFLVKSLLGQIPSPNFRSHITSVLLLLFIALLPAIDFWRWQNQSLGGEAVLLRLPFLVLPFLVLEFEKSWPPHWRKTNFLILLGSFFLALLIFGFQGFSKIYVAARSDSYDQLKTLLHRPYIGIISGVFGLTALSLLWENSKKWAFGIWILFFIPPLWVLSKFSLFAYLVAALGFGLFYLRNHPRFLGLLLFFIIGFTIFISFKVIKSQAFKEFQQNGEVNFETLSKTYANSLNNRSLLWKSSIEILHENQNWIWGLGTGNFQPELDKKISQYSSYLPGIHLNPHNIFFYYWLQYGLLGLALVFLFFIQLFKEARKSSNPGMVWIVIFLFLCCQTEIFLDRELGIQLFLWWLIVLIWDRKPQSPAWESPIF
jgi:O-antigen ligase